MIYFNRPALAERARYAVTPLLLFLIAYISFIPFYYLPPADVAIGSIKVPILKYLPFILTLLLVGLSAIRWGAGGGFGFSRSPLDRYIIIFLSISILSVIKATYPFVSLYKIAYYTATGSFLYYIVYYNIRAISEIKIFFHFIIGICCCVALYGLIEYLAREDFLYGEIFEKFNPYHRRTERVGSFIGNPVVLGSYLTLCLPISLYFSLNESHQRLRTIYRGITCIVLVCMLLTFSRGTWLSMIAGGLIYIAPRVRFARLKQMKNNLVVGFVVVLLSVPVFTALMETSGFGHVQQRAEIRFLKRARSLFQVYGTESYRISQYWTTLGILKEQPLLGIGFGNFTIQFDRYKHSSTPSKRVSDATTTENMYLMFACEMGVLGLVAALALFLVLLKTLYLQCKTAQPSGDVELVYALFAAFSAFLVNMATWDALNHPVLRIFFWILAGLAFRQVSLMKLNSSLTETRQAGETLLTRLNADKYNN